MTPSTAFVLRCMLTCLLGAGASLHAAPAAGGGERPAAASPADAQAVSGDDPLRRLMQAKGLLPGPDATSQFQPGPLARQVRDAASGLVVSAMNFLGVRYRRGGESAEKGFDCSGFTRYVFEHSIGLVLPRRADQQARDAGLLKIARDDLRPGDLVFFNTMRRAFSHVGIYIGEGRFIHAPRPGGEVRIEDMHASYWARRFTGGRRAEPAAGDTSPPGPVVQAALTTDDMAAVAAPAPAQAGPIAAGAPRP